MTSLADVLIEARDLIADPDNWCRFHAARNADGHPIADPTDPTAVRWCAAGALSRAVAATNVAFADAFDLLKLCCVGTGIGPPSPQSTNDICGHTAVLDMYDRAIRLAKDTET
ncbi:MAG: hypothetical protein J2P16_00195 [Mycobacterium sp.]|nr:hypothetical protein [Mycobacterium sp.]